MTQSLLHLFVGLVLAVAGFLPASLIGHDPATAGQGPSSSITTCPAPSASWESGVGIALETTGDAGDTVSFGLPLPAGAVSDAGTLGVTVAGEPVEATVTVLLDELDAEGNATGARAVLIQFPASVVEEDCTEVEVTWQGGSVTVTDEPVPFSETSTASDEAADVATYTIEEGDNGPALVTTDERTEVFYTSREPSILAIFPDGYLADTGILGPLISSSQLGDDLAGLQFLSDAVTPFGLSAMLQESYPLNAAFVIDPTDPEAGFEGWLYDRCATFLAFAMQTGDTRFLREGYRLCAYFADQIELDGEYRGIFTGKPDPDPKYSHLRGLVAYYALTGDESARAAGTAIAELFLNDEDFVAPYRAGYIGDLESLWTERLLAVSIEALTYGYQLTGDTDYLEAATEMVTTATRHITGDAETLAEINPGAPDFPPQNCFIHTAEQAAEGDADEPWCSGWMPALLVEPLLAYQDQTGAPQVDEIFIRLTRYLRDTGSAYFDDNDGNADDTFLSPRDSFDPEALVVTDDMAVDEDNPRILVPLYGAGLDTNGQRQNFSQYSDYLHCLDVTGITAAGIRALQRTGEFDSNPIGPFASEGESFVALHQEFAFCAEWVLADQTRLHRDPATWTADDLAEGLDDPAQFIKANNIGNSSHHVSPARKISWWFNPALMQFALLQEAGVAIPELQPGSIQPDGGVPASGPASAVPNTAPGRAARHPGPIAARSGIQRGMSRRPAPPRDANLHQPGAARHA